MQGKKKNRKKIKGELRQIENKYQDDRLKYNYIKIALNVNVLHTQKKLLNDENNKPKCMSAKRNILCLKTKKKVKSKRIKKNHANINQRKARVAVLISD